MKGMYVVVSIPKYKREYAKILKYSIHPGVSRKTANCGALIIFEKENGQKLKWNTLSKNFIDIPTPFTISYIPATTLNGEKELSIWVRDVRLRPSLDSK